MNELELTIPVVQEISISEWVRDLNAQFLQLWWDSSCGLPTFSTNLEPRQQEQHEKQLARLVDGLMVEMKRLPAGPEGRAALQERMRTAAGPLALTALNLTAPDLKFIEETGLLDASQEFARMARRFDPAISPEDIYQAARNVMSMNLTQLLMDLPVAVTEPVFAYSMLYPYSDNYLDDPSISAMVKRDFNTRFQLRLQGETIRPANRHEEMISELVGRIENQFERARFPLVWDSLTAIHKAQARSLRLTAPGASPYEADVLGITFEKGGTSVLADGYLVAGWLAPEEAAFLYGYGAFTQLMDDLEDVEGDRRDGRLTVFSQTAPHWTLDAVTNRTIHFGRQVFQMARAFHAPAAGPLLSIIDRALDPAMLDLVGRAGRYYSPAYRREMERHLAFRFGCMQKQRARLERHKITLGKLIDLWV